MKFLSATAIAILLSTSAYAADATYEAPAFSWTGGYLGVEGGYGWTDGTFTTTGFVPLYGDFDGGILGAFAGYNHQFANNIVLGIDGTIDYNWNETTLASAFGTVVGGTTWQGSVTGRLGFAVDRALFYAAAGWAITRAEAEIIGVGSDDATFNGYTIGGGIDYAFTDTVFGRIDYRYTDFGSQTFDFGVATPVAELTQHTLKTGIGFKF